jgi:GNAT superfamily N-acetyltransferase
VSVPVIRPAANADLEPVRRFLAGLSTDSAYRRFFSGLGTPSPRTVRRLVHAERGHSEAVVADLDGEVVGLANAGRPQDEPVRAEFGVVVADRWQRRGLGPRLVQAVLWMAVVEGGATGFRAHTLAENGPAIRLIRRTWPAARPTWDGNLLVWDLPLAPVRWQLEGIELDGSGGRSPMLASAPPEAVAV